MARGDDIQERLVDFAVVVIRMSASLPKTPAGRHIAGQILRSGTSPAPNYAEARGAESKEDFVHKLRIVLKELNETGIWLRIIDRSHLYPTARLGPVQSENDELCKIIGASIMTTQARTAATGERRKPG